MKKVTLRKKFILKSVLFVSLGATLLFNSCGSSAEEEAAAEDAAAEMVEEIMEDVMEEESDVYSDTLRRGERPADQDDTYYKREPEPAE